MTGKTHAAVGMASALAVIWPDSPGKLAVGIGGAMIGSVISDIDVSTSESRREVNRVLLITALLLAVVGYLEVQYHLGILAQFRRSSSVMRLITGLAFFLMACIYGKGQPHRGFMHSILAVAIFGGLMYYIFPMAAEAFAVAMLSHIGIDLLNKKRVQVLFPIKSGFCLKLCKADGIVNASLFYLASLVAIVELVMICTQLGFAILHSF